MEVNIMLGGSEHILDIDRYGLVNILHHLLELPHAVKVLGSTMQLLVELPLDQRPDSFHRIEGAAIRWLYHWLKMLF